MHGKYVGLAIPVRNFNKVLGRTAQGFAAKADANGEGVIIRRLEKGGKFRYEATAVIDYETETTQRHTVFSGNTEAEVREKMEKAGIPLNGTEPAIVQTRGADGAVQYEARVNLDELENSTARKRVFTGNTEAEVREKLRQAGIPLNMEATGVKNSVQWAISHKWGESGLNYIEKLMKDIQTGRTRERTALDAISSKYAGAVLTLNASVAMKQFASYPAAGAVLGARPLLQAITMKNAGADLELIQKYTPLLWYRSQGYNSRELGDMTARRGPMEEAMRDRKFLNWIQAVDVWTTRKLWLASELYVQQNRAEFHLEDADYQQKTDAFYKSVAEIYNRVIEETQPNYTTMQRPQLLRSEDSLTQSLMMFKTQPFQNFNVLYDAAGNYLAKRNSAGFSETEIREAGRDLRRAVGSQVVQLLMFAGMTAAWAFLRGKTDKYKDEDGETTPLSFAMGLGKDMIGGVFSMAPWGTELWDASRSLLFGERYYGIDAVNVSAVSDTVSGILSYAGFLRDFTGELREAVKNAMSGETDFASALREIDWKKAWLENDRLIDTVSKFLGVPYENVANLTMAIASLPVRIAKGGVLGEYAVMKWTANPVTGGGYDLLYRALKNNDLDAARYIMEDLQSYRNSAGHPVTGKIIATNMKNRAKRKGVTLSAEAMALIGMVDKLEVPQEENSTFSEDNLRGSAWIRFNDQRAEIQRRVLTELEHSPAWEDLSDEEKNKATSGVLTYAKETALAAHSNGEYEPETSWVPKAQTAEKEYGIDVGTFLAARAHAAGFQGEGITNYKGLQIWEYVTTLGLTEEQEQRIMADLGVGKKVLEMDEDERYWALDEAREMAEDPDRDEDEEEDED